MILRFPGRGAAPQPSTAEPLMEPPDVAQIVEALATGACPPDAAFDELLACPLRRLSRRYWTPLAVAVRAAQWFDERNVRTVVDIGSGAGKFCVAAALACHCHFTGLEHRGHLVAHARMLARRFGVENRTHFIHGALGEVRLPSADAYYLYNPFEENVLDSTDRIDDEVDLGRGRLARDLQFTHSLLARAPAGTYVLTYDGFGASLPASYRQVRVDRELPSPLWLWQKAPSTIFGRSPHVGADGPPGAA